MCPVSFVTHLARGKGSALDGQGRVGTDRGELRSDVQGNLLVARSRCRGGVLVLRDGSNLGVRRGLVAKNRRLADSRRVPLKSTEQDRLRLTVDIPRRLGVREGLVGDDLLEAVEVLDVGGTLRGGGVAEEGKDSVLDLQWVIKLQVRLGGGDDGLVRVLLGHFPLDNMVVQRDLTGSSQAGEGQDGRLVLHLCEGERLW